MIPILSSLLCLFLATFSAPALGDSIPENLEGVKTGQQIYLDIDDNVVKSAFDKPGYDYDTCKKGVCEVKAWPNRDRVIYFDGATQVVKMPNIYHQNQMEDITYIRVKIPFFNKETAKPDVHTLWMVADPFKLKSYRSVFETKTKKSSEPCDDILAQGQSYVDLTESKLNKNIQEIFEKISGAVGRCPKEDPKKLNLSFNKGVVPFDQVVMPMLKKTKFPSVKKAGGKSITRDEYYAIDAHARTCFAEMGVRCATNGPEYVFAWERMTLNRAWYVERNTPFASRFSMSHHPKNETPKVAVAVEPSQYDVWAHPNNVGVSLCPPSNLNKFFYLPEPLKNRHPLKLEFEAWSICLKAAIEGVLYTDEFKKVRTKGFEEVSYRTGDSPTKLKDVRNAKILGRPITNRNCMRVLRDETLPRPSQLDSTEVSF